MAETDNRRRTPRKAIVFMLLCFAVAIGLALSQGFSSPAVNVGPPDVTVPAGSPDATGLGAKRAAWDAHHVADPDLLPGSAYDPTPGLRLANGNGGDRYNDRYVAVNPTGVVSNYEMQLYPGTSLGDARSQAMREFPPDARVVSFQTRRDCAIEVITSKKVYGIVEFSKRATPSRFDRNDVAWLNVLAWPRGAAPPGC